MNKGIFTFSFFLFLASLLSCTGSSLQHNQLSEEEEKEGWVLLFDGTSTSGWHGYNMDNGTAAWEAKNGELFCNPEDTSDPVDLVTDREYENYDFRFDWKISEGGNSGVFINVLEQPDIPTTWASAPEYQLLENANINYATPTKRAGCLYGFAPQKTPVTIKPAGEWNQSRIKQVNGKVEFYLNDTLTAAVDLTAQAWQDTVANSGFKTFPHFGKATKGRIALQDWATGISFRNLRIKEL